MVNRNNRFVERGLTAPICTGLLDLLKSIFSFRPVFCRDFTGNSVDCGISIPDHEGDEWIYNNYFNYTMNIRLGISGGNTWNSSLTPGTNIIGSPSRGGNFWANPNGTGFSQKSTDLDEDGICDFPYEVNASEFDYLPLSFPNCASGQKNL